MLQCTTSSRLNTGHWRFSCVQDFSLSEQHPGLVIYVRSLFYLHQALGYILLWYNCLSQRRETSQLLCDTITDKIPDKRCKAQTPPRSQHRTDLQLVIFIRYIYCNEWKERKTDKFYNIHFAELSCPSWCGAPVWEILMVTSYCVKPRWNVSSRSSLSQHLSPHSHWPEPGRTPQSASRRLTCQSLSHIYNIWTTWDGHQSPGNTANLGWYFPVDCHTVSGYDESSPEPWI